MRDNDGLLATTGDRAVVANWPVYLSIGGVRQTPGAMTGTNGCYTWTNLQPGLSYDVEEDVLPGWTALTPVKHDFGASVSGGVYSYTFINQGPGGCALTPGYWSTHSKYGPAGPYDPTWDLKAGGDAKFLTDAWNTGFTWYSIMWEPPAGGNAYLILAQHYVAAWLNTNNVDPAKQTSAAVLGTTMADAEALLGMYTPASYMEGDRFLELAGILDMYNNGMYPGGPPHCP